MLGISFADHLDNHIKKFSHKSRHTPDTTELISTDIRAGDNGIPSIWKRLGIKYVMFLLMGLLIAHIFTLQFIRGKYYKALADGNGLVRRPVEAARGVITDRNGNVLVRNTPYVTLDNTTLVSYKEYMQMESTLSAELKKKATLYSIREYQYPDQLAHVLGYISPITEEEMKDSKKLTSNKKINYSLQDVVGRTGIEEQYEQFLRGESGAELVEVNALGEVQKVLGKQEAIPGRTLRTSLDAKLQDYIYKQLSATVTKEGAISGVAVVQDPNNGRILALVNYPSFDNNAFTHPLKNKDLETYFTSEKTPLLNRAITGTYPPGSTFKMVTALAGLESKTITSATTYEDTGSITLSGITFNNWFYSEYGKNEGYVDVKKALARSNDTFFYKMALDAGVEKLVEEAYKFRFGQTLGIDIPGEAKGIIPTPEWKQIVKNEQWYPGNTVNMSIGQGDVLVTPLQISSMTSAIANQGTLYQPSFVYEIYDSAENKLCAKNNTTGKWEGIKECDPLNKSALPPAKLSFDEANLKTIREGMHMVAKQGGTAYPFFEFNIDTAGKTGTAESIPDKKPHAWYTGFAPYNNPEISVTVLIEQGGEGSRIAAPVVKDIMNYYFTETKKTAQVAQN